MSIFDIFRRKKEIPAPWKKFYTEGELKFKIPDITMYDQIKMVADKYPYEYAIEYYGKKYTYKKFMNKIDKAATSFSEMGIKKGDIVTLCMPNVPEVLYCLYGLNKIGAIASMLHPLSAEEEIKDSIIATKSKALVIMDMFYNKIENTIKSTNVSNVIFVCASDSMNVFMRLGYFFTKKHKYKKTPNRGLFMNYAKFMRKSWFKEPVSKLKGIGKNTPCIILNSGGTSGKPKHVVLQNRAFNLVNYQAHLVLKNMNIGSSCLGIMPNFHGFGLAISMHVMIGNGFKVHMVPQFDANKFDKLLKDTKPSFILGVPTLFEALINNKNVDNLDLSCVKYVVSGGDTLHKNLEDKVNEFLKEHNSTAVITQGYGMTESLAGVCIGLGKVNKSGSVGVPLPGNYVKIIDPGTRKTLPYGEVGEICIHTRGLMLGYLNNESETNEALQVHDDGYVWLHSGDLGLMDEDGFVFYKGRAKRMIICSGYNVYPAHIEEVIESHPAVLQCSVVGIPHPYKQEVPKAFIVLKEGFHGLFIKSEIKDYCKKNLAHYMVPYKFVYRKSLPKTKLAKVDFKSLQNDEDGDDY